VPYLAGAVNMSAPATAKTPKPPPEGVERSTQATLRYAFGLPAVDASAPRVVAATKNVEKFLTSPLAESLPDGFTARAPAYSSYISTPCNVLGLSLMTKKKKPMAAAFLFDDVEESSGCLVIVMRGDRTKQSEHQIFDMDENTIDAFTNMVYTTNPKEPCNFHPWFSSILLSFASDRTDSGAIVLPFVNSVKPVDAKLSRVISNSIKLGRVMLAVCLPSSQSTESVLHKLAIDKAGPLSFSVLGQHNQGWTALANKAGLQASHIHGKFKEVSDGVQQFSNIVAGLNTAAAAKATAPAPVAAPAAASKRSAVLDDDDDDELESAPKKTRVEESAAASNNSAAEKSPVSRQSEKPEEKKKKINNETREDPCKRSGHTKFIAEAIEGSRKEGECEERETRKFEKRLKKMQDTDDDGDEGSDSGSGSDSGKKKKKKKKKKLISDSESGGEESELSNSHESEEESSEEESSDEESDEDSEDEASATSSDDEDDKPKKKRRRLVKVAEMQDGNGTKLTHTTLNLSSAAGSSSAGTSDTKRKQVSRPPPAKGNRAGVAAQCNLMLDSVEACTGIPLSLMEKVSSLVAELRDGFSDYESDKFPIKKTYALHTATFNLAMTLLNIINSNLTPDQKNGDASASRRLAVSTTSALLNIIPSLDQVDAQMRESIKAIEALQKMTVAIANDFNVSAAKIDSE